MAKLTADELHRFPLFGELDAHCLAALSAACSVREYGAGELVLGHNDTSYDVFFLVSGRLQVNLYSADGQRVGFHEMSGGGMFGEISAVDGLPRSVSVEAAVRCRVALLPRQRFIDLIRDHPGFAMAVTRQLASHVRRLTTRVFEFSTMAVRQRLRAELLRLARSEAGDSAVIDPVPTHAELASRISTHREAVSREMAWLDSHGLVVKKGRSLAIPSVTRIRSLIEESWND
ncbi:Crp/Fnr family transcriptional regulator [Aestuariivirga litoralis]|uniref:Crp/Fnr family transcriptional regulator n=1 Tax=Aestuariivirga litoralis TaxID=2650924 RepID=UPI0013796F5C|nr:Crp/Fnr family transcriptional regulator [Aestuariivirga litoralis]